MSELCSAQKLLKYSMLSLAAIEPALIFFITETPELNGTFYYRTNYWQCLECLVYLLKIILATNIEKLSRDLRLKLLLNYFVIHCITKSNF